MGLMTEDYFFDTMNYSNSVNIKLHRFEVRHKNSTLYGYYSVDKNKLFIGQKSTFGGVYLQDDTVREDLENLVKKFEDEFLRKYSGYNLRLPPNYLNKKLNEFSNIFNSIGSSVITEINQYHEITNNSNYLLFSKSNRKIFRRLKANGCTIKLSKKTKWRWILFVRKKIENCVMLSYHLVSRKSKNKLWHLKASTYIFRVMTEQIF